MFEKRKLIKLARRNGWTIKETQYYNYLQVQVYDNTRYDNPIYDKNDFSYYMNYASAYKQIIIQIERDKYPQENIIYTPGEKPITCTIEPDEQQSRGGLFT